MRQSGETGWKLIEARELQQRLRSRTRSGLCSRRTAPASSRPSWPSGSRGPLSARAPPSTRAARRPRSRPTASARRRGPSRPAMWSWPPRATPQISRAGTARCCRSTAP
jgi:hypothetical protein